MKENDTNKICDPKTLQVLQEIGWPFVENSKSIGFKESHEA